MLSVVIIAAGVASRLKPYSEEMHKCLMELEPNVTILDLILKRLEKIDSDRTLIVVRPQFRDVFEERLNKKAELIEADVVEFGNLYSVGLAMRRLDRGPFLLLMSDHIFEQSILDRMLSSRSQAAFTVCLDREPSKTDAEEGLKLTLRGESVLYAGKKASPQYGIDTGIILCREKSKIYIEKALENSGLKATIADALNLAAADSEVDYVDVTGKLWKDVDTPDDLIKARKVYWQIRREELTKSGEGLISRHLYRPISTRISIAMHRSGFIIEPLKIALLSFILGLSASLILAFRGYIFGGLLVQLVPVLDGVSGELVELCRKTLSWEAYIDLVLDHISDVALIAGLALSSPIRDHFTLFLTILAAGNVILVSYVTRELNSLGVRTEKLRIIPVTRDSRLFIISVSSLLTLPIYGLYYLAIVPIFYLCYSTYLALKIGRGIKLEGIIRQPRPEVRIEKKEMSKKIGSLISNSVKLGLALLVVNMVGPAILGITLVNLDGLTLSSDYLLSVFNLIIIIYFGYRIIQALKAIIDMTTGSLVALVGVTETTLKRILFDTLYSILALVLWLYLPTTLRSIPYIGEYVSRGVILIILVFFFAIFYDLAKTLYATFGDFYKEIVEKISERLHENSK